MNLAPTNLKTTGFVGVVCVALIIGTGIGFFLRPRLQQQSTSHVNADWVVLARKCWMGFSSWHDDAIDRKLNDPNLFRATFVGFKTLNDAEIAKLAAMPTSNAPEPEPWEIYGGHAESIQIPPDKSEDWFAKNAPKPDISSTDQIISDLRGMTQDQQRQTLEKLPLETKKRILASLSGEGVKSNNPTLCVVQENIPAGLDK